MGVIQKAIENLKNFYADRKECEWSVNYTIVSSDLLNKESDIYGITIDVGAKSELHGKKN